MNIRMIPTCIKDISVRINRMLILHELLLFLKEISWNYS